tara:strand:- start:5261 stop:5506 length:246 start_codon:yes stop_codon:yes gene_type:complete
MTEAAHLSGEVFLKLANYRMPFGKYANKRLVEIPEEYFIWFSKKGFPAGELGEFMSMMLEIKVNGLEYLFDPLHKSSYRNH